MGNRDLLRPLILCLALINTFSVHAEDILNQSPISILECEHSSATISNTASGALGGDNFLAAADSILVSGSVWQRANDAAVDRLHIEIWSNEGLHPESLLSAYTVEPLFTLEEEIVGRYDFVLDSPFAFPEAGIYWILIYADDGLFIPHCGSNDLTRSVSSSIALRLSDQIWILQGAHYLPIVLSSQMPDTDNASLLAHWKLDETAGFDVLDSSGNGHHGTLLGDPERQVSGPVGSSLSLDGLDDFARIADPGVGWDLDLTTGFTLGLWILPRSLSGQEMLISKDNSYELELGHAGPGRYSVRLNNFRRGFGETPLEEGVWQYLVVTWDGDTVSYYYNGDADGSAIFDEALQTNNLPIGLGARPAFHFDGAMDDIRIYDQALDATEVTELFATFEVDDRIPQRSNGRPDAVAAGSVSALLELATNLDAQCRYSETAGTPFQEMPGIFSVTGGRDHSAEVTLIDGSGSADGQISSYFVRCMGTSGLANIDDYEISFLVGELSNLIAHWPFDADDAATAADVPFSERLGSPTAKRVGLFASTSSTTTSASRISPMVILSP